MTDSQIDLLCLGEPLGEFNATRGEAGAFLFGHGGDTSNCAVAAARQGMASGYLGALAEIAWLMPEAWMMRAERIRSRGRSRGP